MAFQAGALTQVSVQAVGDVLSSAVAVSGTTPYTYQWYRSTSSGFSPGTSNIVSGATGLTLTDSPLAQGTQYYYKVIATDSAGTPHLATSAQLAVTTLVAGAVNSRYTQKLFGINAGANQMSRFGDLASSYPSVPSRYTGGSITPALIQQLANFQTGWFGSVVGGNAPAEEDMNALCYLFAYQLYYLLQAGVPAWDSGTTYSLGSIVQDGSGNLYSSLINNNLNGPTTSSVYWQPIQIGASNLVNATNVALLGHLSAVSGMYPGSSSNAYLRGSNPNTLDIASPSYPSTGTTYPIVVSASPSNSGLQIVRGVFGPTGTIVIGEGFTVNHTGTGTYVITPTTAFIDSPAVTASPYSGVGTLAIVVVTTLTNSSFTLQAYLPQVSASPVDFEILFTAIGQRNG